MFEVDARQVAAVVMDVVLTANLAVGDDVDSGTHLVGDHLSGRSDEQFLGLVTGDCYLVGPAGGVILIR